MLLKKISTLLSATTLLLFFAAQSGCKKNDSIDNTKPGLETPITADDAVKVTATVTGTVIDENNKPVSGVAVTASNASTTTDAMGNFVFKNISISAANGFVTVIKAGYFKGIRSFVTDAGKNNYVKIQLIKQVVSGTITNATGGVVNVTGGATITFPADAFVTASGNAYTGNVSVLAHWIDPTAPNLPLVVPGDLRGINSSNGEYLLKSYGMVGAEFTDNSGNALKIAPGKTAAISFPIPAGLQATAPATIPLWHFDEATARWKEEGAATKSGTNYTGQVNKFSFWNIDMPGNFIKLNMLLKNAANNLPLANTLVKITSLTTNTSAYGHTNDSGYVSGYVPKNENLKLEVIASTVCPNNAVLHSQNIGPYNANTSLGTINISIPATHVINFTGTVKNCNNQPVTNGYVSISLSNGIGTIAVTDATGAVNFSLPQCGGTNNYNYTAVDLTTGNYSNVVNGTTTGNSVNLGSIAACGNVIISTGVYIAGSIANNAVLWIDGIPTFLTNYPVGSLNRSGSALQTLVYNNKVYVLIADKDSTAAGYTEKINLWVDGVTTTVAATVPGGLGPRSAKAKRFDVFNNDVYILGSYQSGTDMVSIWKNGQVFASSMPKDTFEAVTTHDIKVVNGEVYVAGSGYKGNANPRDKPIYWKNGTVNVLNNTIAGNSGSISERLFFANGSIYISGTCQVNFATVRPTYWKDGVQLPLPIPSPYTAGGLDWTPSIYVENSNVYVGGAAEFVGNSVYKNACYWKDGNINFLTNTTNLGDKSWISDIYVKNGIVFSVGNSDINNFPVMPKQPLYFQNTLAIPLTGFTANQVVRTNSIFVK